MLNEKTLRRPELNDGKDISGAHESIWMLEVLKASPRIQITFQDIDKLDKKFHAFVQLAVALV